MASNLDSLLQKTLSKITNILEAPKEIPKFNNELYEIENRIKDKLSKNISEEIPTINLLRTITEYPLAENEVDIKTFPSTVIDDINELMLSTNRNKQETLENLKTNNNETLHDESDGKSISIIYQDALRSKGMKLPKTMGYFEENRKKIKSFYIERRNKTKSFCQNNKTQLTDDPKSNVKINEKNKTKNKKNLSICQLTFDNSTAKTPLLKVNLKEFVKLQREEKNFKQKNFS